MVLGHVQGMSRVPPDHPEGGAEGELYSEGLCQDAPAPTPHRAHLPVGGELAGLSEPFQARSCGCTPHNVFRAVW
jgi:hypothetical protein